MSYSVIPNGCLTSVSGFRAAGVHCGLKPTKDKDLALVYSEAPCRAAAVFTTNQVKAAPVLWNQDILAKDREGIQAVVINSGNANACTGQQGIADVYRMATLLAYMINYLHKTKLSESNVLVMSTGVIGVILPFPNVAQGILEAADQLSDKSGHDAALAIMTTDTYPKEIAVQIQLSLPVPENHQLPITIAGMAKGAGMIHPDMATLLCLIVTDAAISAHLLDRALRSAVDRSFHNITIDGDTSTNDSILLLANGLAGNVEIVDEDGPDFAAFQEGLTYVATELAKMIVQDGEGATKFVSITVKGASGFGEAKQVAMAIARSPLVKTSLYGQDANWGRVLCAVGYSGVAVEPERIALWFGSPEDDGPPLQLVRDGQPFDVDEARAAAILSCHDVDIIVDLGLGQAEATIWTCDLSHDYVSINAHYRT